MSEDKNIEDVLGDLTAKRDDVLDLLGYGQTDDETVARLRAGLAALLAAAKQTVRIVPFGDVTKVDMADLNAAMEALRAAIAAAEG